MPSFIHRRLRDRILAIDAAPSSADEFRKWIRAEAHLSFLRSNAQSEEVVIYGSGPYTFIHTILMPNQSLNGFDENELLKWSCNPYASIASYVSGGGRDGTWVERGGHGRGSKLLNAGTDLIFARTFEGWSGAGGNYHELQQEFAHLTAIHWRPEEHAYCRFDDSGDLRHVVSSTVRNDSDISLVSFTWPELQEYLINSDQSLIRMYDFTLCNRDSFAGWPEIRETVVRESENFFYRQFICGESAYTRGVQIIRAHKPDGLNSQSGNGDRTDTGARMYADFIIHDWRNKCLNRVSTDPEATSNYFQADGNKKPFELSPAFFRPEVLSKYKTDREKYTIKDCEVMCRNAWYLKGYDVNEAGQVHAYICDLRRLPYSEQLHWQSYNEEPKTSISERAYLNDFMGEFVTFSHPREEIMSTARRWAERSVAWWKLRDPALLDRANVPLTTSKDEWSEAVMDVAKLVIEGFDMKAIRDRLDKLGGAYEKDDRTITLLEKLVNYGRHSADAFPLAGLREAQRIRSKIGGHVKGAEAKEILEAAILEHGSLTEHFTSLCRRVSAELETISLTFEGGTAG